jgi:hypothetical protein
VDEDTVDSSIIWNVFVYRKWIKTDMRAKIVVSQCNLYVHIQVIEPRSVKAQKLRIQKNTVREHSYSGFYKVTQEIYIFWMLITHM